MGLVAGIRKNCLQESNEAEPRKNIIRGRCFGITWQHLSVLALLTSQQ